MGVDWVIPSFAFDGLESTQFLVRRWVRFDKRYFTLRLMAPYSKRLDHHLYVHLKYPREVPKEFLQELERLVNRFEKHVPARGK